jgi:hypothetical protein
MFALERYIYNLYMKTFQSLEYIYVGPVPFENTSRSCLKEDWQYIVYCLFYEFTAHT